jgi:prolyl-tRNA editing enzyme YbaK/EbsC (Cys-tRNA(Pro) deacylase)
MDPVLSPPFEHTFDPNPCQHPPRSAGRRLAWVSVRLVHANAQRVADALRAGGASGEVSEHETSARTAEEAAATLDVPVGAIVKSLVFAADGEPLLVLASGDHQVDTALVAEQVGASKVKRADVDTVRAATGFPIGGVAPIGHPSPLRTVVDRRLARFDVVWAAAGTPNSVFPTSYEELLRLTGGVACDVGAT